MPVLCYKQAWQNSAGENKMTPAKPAQRGRPPKRPSQDAFNHALSLVTEINKGTGKTPAKVIAEVEQMQQLLAQKLNKLKQLDDAKS